MDQQHSTTPGAGSTYLKCLSCSKLVRLPANPDPDAIVRCPRCEQTYPIGVLLDSEIPELEIVGSSDHADLHSPGESDADEVDIKTDDKNRFIVAPALAKGAKRKKRRRSSSSESSPSTSPKNASTRSEPSTKSSTSERSSSSRRRKSSKSSSSNQSGGFEFTKIILGAMLAPPVAQLVIWWGLQLDPLNFGPTVAEVIPAVVPGQFHREAEDMEDKTKDEKPKGDNANGWDAGSNPDTKSSDTKINDELPNPPSNIEDRVRNND